MSDKHPSLLMGTKINFEKNLREEVARLRAALDNRDARISDLEKKLAATKAEGWKPTHRHIGRGTEYMRIGAGRIQSDVPLNDGASVIVYIGKDDDIWARRFIEFHDGRFEVLT